MNLAFRMDCPKCKWGYAPLNSHINQGFLKGKCTHCENKFFFKITVTGINMEVEQELPEGQPCKTLPEAKEGN